MYMYGKHHPRWLSLGFAALGHAREPPAYPVVPPGTLGWGSSAFAPYVCQGASWPTCRSSWIFTTTEKARKNRLQKKCSHFLRETVSHKKTLSTGICLAKGEITYLKSSLSSEHSTHQGHKWKSLRPLPPRPRWCHSRWDHLECKVNQEWIHVQEKDRCSPSTEEAPTASVCSCTIDMGSFMLLKPEQITHFQDMVQKLICRLPILSILQKELL